MKNVDFGVDELAGFFGGLDSTECLPLSCRRRHHSCIQCFSIYVDSHLRDTKTQAIQSSCGQATNYMPELVPTQLIPHDCIRNNHSPRVLAAHPIRFNSVRPYPNVGIGGGCFIESVVRTTHGGGKGGRGRGNDGGRLRPAGPRRGNIRGEWGGDMTDVKMGGRNVLAHSGFVLIKCIVIGPRV